ncbi:MAG: DUF3556 domain-containing protein, partial [Marmoricola sp.]
MGFLQPNLPDLDVAVWRKGTRNERMRPVIRHLCEVGFGTPDVVFVFYVAKIGLYLLAAMGFALTTAGIDGFTDVGTWWSEPIMFEKLVLFSALFEVLGLGCGFGPLNLRFTPPLGSFLYWLRPGTIRLPPWSRVPFTRGDRRTVADVALYAGLLTALVIALVSDGTRPSGLDGVGLIPVWKVVLVLGLLVVLGLRDRTVFLAARSEVYGAIAVMFLFSGGDLVVGAKLMMLVIWLGAATSKLNRHFPFVVQAMMSNSPIFRSKVIKRRFHRDFPDDLRPSRISEALAHGGTVVELGVPLVMFFSHGGTVTTVAAVVMICFHLNILLSIPMGVPLEWNVFMILGICTLFVDKSGYGFSDLDHPALVLAVVAVSAGTVVLGNLFPQKISFLPGMRYYAGNWDTTVWCFTQAGLDKFDAGTTKVAQLPHQQLEKIYGKEEAEVPLYTGYAFRAMHTHGRAHFALIPRVCGPDHEDYLVLDGELVAGVVLGWNFGDGHLHDERLIAALQQRCGFEPGELRVILLDAQPAHRGTQEYRLVDAATGEFERGTV